MLINARSTITTLLVATLMSHGCSTDASRDETECQRIYAAKNWERAEQLCAADHREGGDPEAGILAMKSAYFLGRYKDVIDWSPKLRGTPHETNAINFEGFAEIALGRMDEGISRLVNAARRFEDEGNSNKACRAWYRICTTRWRQSRLADAVRTCAEAYRIVLPTDDLQMQSVVVSTMLSLFRDLGDLSSGRRLLAQVESGAIETAPGFAARFLNHSGLLRNAEGRFEMARAAWEKAIVQLPAEENRSLVRGIQLNLVAVNLKLGDLRRATEHLRAASEHVEDTPISRLAFHYHEGLLRYEQGDLAGAASAFVAASEEIKEAESPDWTWRVQLELGRTARALDDEPQAMEAFRASVQALEQMRRESTLSDLKAWEMQEKRRPYEALFLAHARADEAAQAFQVVEQATARTFLDVLVSSIDPGADGEPQDAILRAEALSQILPVVHESASAEPRDVPQLRSLVNKRSALIYFEAEDEVWRLALLGGKLDLDRLPETRQSIARMVRRFQARPGDRALAEELAVILLPASMPPPATHLFFVTDGLLGDIPLSALRWNDGYLVERHTLTVIPSLSVLAFLEQQPPSVSSAASIFGDPLEDLDAARSEAYRVAEILGAHAHVGPGGTLEALRQAGGGLLHLATHSGLDSRGPWLQLSDGRIGPDAILRDRIRADVVVLASCASSARGRKGLWGSLASSFLSNGSGTVIASLWSVADDAASRLVLDFYLASGATRPAHALAVAQRKSIGRQDSVDLWSAFVAYGLPGGVHEKGGKK